MPYARNMMICNECGLDYDALRPAPHECAEHPSYDLMAEDMETTLADLYTAHPNSDGTWVILTPQGERISDGWTENGAKTAARALTLYPHGWTHAG